MPTGDELTFASTDLVVGQTTDSVLMTRNVPRGAKVLGLQVINASTSAFNQFITARRFHLDVAATYERMATVATDYASTAVDVAILEASGAPVTLGSSASAFIRFDVRAWATIQLIAQTTAVGTAHVFGIYHY